MTNKFGITIDPNQYEGLWLYFMMNEYWLDLTQNEGAD